MKRSEKKGFTIVELVIVIAVIAILAAVLIPNLSKLVTNANETADTMLIKELNTALDLDLERHETMYDALVAVERAGFIVSRINASVAGNEILWDSVNDCFVYLKGNEIVYQANREETPVDRSKKYLYWRIYESLPTEQTYSIYLNNETYNAETSVTVGFDAGRNKNAFAVNYTGTGTAQKVILRTDGQNLTVNAEHDTVNHYGATRTLTVTAVATSDCYHEHGFVGTLASFGSGKLVAYRGAQYHQTKDDIVAQLNGKTFDLDKAIFEQHYYQDGVCIICGAGGEPTVKNGLVDGYYYKDDKLFTGSENEHEFYEGKLVIDLNSKQYENSSLHLTVKTRIFNYIISSDEYLTDELVIRGDNSSYDSPAIINITDNSGRSYTVQSIKAKTPFGDLLKKNGWTVNDINSILMNEKGRSLISGGYILRDKNLLAGYSSESDDPDSYDIFVPMLCADSDVVESYLSLTGCADIGEYYTKYQSNSLLISFVDYLKLLYGKGYTLTNDNGTINYTKTFGNNYQSESIDGFYVSVVADANTGLPILQLVGGDGTYMSAPTQADDGVLSFCEYVLDADDKTHCTNGNYLTFLKFVGNVTYYVSITENVVIVRNGSTTGTEVCRFEIDNDNHIIKSYLKSTITDANGLPYSMPSSGNMTVVDGKISLTGAFDINGVDVPFVALSGLAGLKNSENLMFDTELIELIMKAAYLDTMSVVCNNLEYKIDSVPASVFTKTGNTWSVKIESSYSDSARSILYSNLFNGVDHAGTSYEIVLKVTT